MTDHKDLFNALNHAAILTETDLDGKIISANARFCEISGYSEAELLGSTHHIVNSNYHPKEFFIELWQTISNGDVWIGEICNKNKDGQDFWMHATIFPIFRENTREIYKYAAIRFDINDKKREELALKNHIEHYRAAIETTDGFCYIDNKEGRFLEVSDNFCQLSGYHREELLTMSFCDTDGSLYDDDEASKSQWCCSDILEKIMLHDCKMFESKRRRKDGSIWLAEITATASPINNNTIFLFIHDITERRAAEKENEILKKQVYQMQKVDSIGRLTSGIAHDFNNILACMLGYNELNTYAAQDINDHALQAEVTANTTQIAIAGKRAVELIEKMLTYCRQDTIRTDMKVRPTGEIISEVLELLRPVLTRKINVLSTVSTDCTIEIDATDLQQVLMNLLVNARDAMKNDSSINNHSAVIHVEVKLIHDVQCQCDACLTMILGDFIELSVSDCGGGMDKEVIKHIFDPFFTTKEVGEGTGLGLSVVSGIVHHSRGHIVIESSIEKGTTFRLLFPTTAPSTH
ncbi:MAG: hypothetical protein RL755_977 [Pseudomonadota bacterium]